MIIVQIIPSFLFGGAEIMCANLSKELKNLGLNVVVVSLYNQKSSISYILENAGVQVIYLNKKKGFDLSLFIKLFKLFKELKPDVVHTHLYSSKYAQIVATLLRVKVKIHTIHSMANHSDGFVGRLVNKLLFKYLHVTPVSLSKEVQNSVITVYNLTSDDTPIVENGIPLNECIQIQNYKETAETILHVGRFVNPKNHYEIIRGMSKVHGMYPNIKLKLYGEGSLEDECRKQVNELGLMKTVEFCGTTDNIYKVMASADIFILPSLWEGLPLTLLEAMATGLPIIASSVGGIPNVVDDNLNGILIKPNGEELSIALCSIIDDRQRRERLGRHALKKSMNYSSERMAMNYYLLYRNLGL